MIPNWNLIQVGHRTFFTTFDASKEIVYCGGFAEVNENVKVAIGRNYNLKKKQGVAEIGSAIQSNAHVRAKFGLDSTVELIAGFSPRSWVDVSFRSITSILPKRPVAYGWALDFHTNA